MAWIGLGDRDCIRCLDGMGVGRYGIVWDISQPTVPSPGPPQVNAILLALYHTTLQVTGWSSRSRKKLPTYLV